MKQIYDYAFARYYSKVMLNTPFHQFYFAAVTYINLKNLKIMIKLKNPILLQFEELMSSPDYQTNDVAYTLMYKEVDLKNWDLEDKLTLHFFLSNTEVKANNGGTEENRNEFRAKMIDEIDTLLEKVPHEEQLDMMGHLFKNYFFKFFYEEVEEVDENSKV